MSRNSCFSQQPMTPHRGATHGSTLSRTPTGVVGEAPAGQRLKLLIVSEQTEMLDELVRITRDCFDVVAADRVALVKHQLTLTPFDLILADQKMHGMTGVDLLVWVRQHFPHILTILLTDHADLQLAMDALQHGWIYGCALRTAGSDEILEVLSQAASQSIRWESLKLVRKDCWQFGMNLAHTDQERLLNQDVDLLRWHMLELEAENRRLRVQKLDLACQVTTDKLTKLLCRVAIESIAQAEITRRVRHPGPLALALIDADYFRSVNSQHLLPGGDQALIGLADALTRSLRATDQVGRIGGDEFLLVAPQTDLAGATALAERLRGAVEQQQVYYQGKAINLTVSIGFAVVEAGTHVHLDFLRHRAAIALSEAKQRRNCSVVHAVQFSH